MALGILMKSIIGIFSASAVSAGAFFGLKSSIFSESWKKEEQNFISTEVKSSSKGETPGKECTVFIKTKKYNSRDNDNSHTEYKFVLNQEGDINSAPYYDWNFSGLSNFWKDSRNAEFVEKIRSKCKELEKEEGKSEIIIQKDEDKDLIEKCKVLKAEGQRLYGLEPNRFWSSSSSGDEKLRSRYPEFCFTI